MVKTDKELTVEVVNNFVNSWNARSNTTALQSSDLKDLIKTVYKTIKDLPEDTE